MNFRQWAGRTTPGWSWKLVTHVVGICAVTLTLCAAVVRSEAAAPPPPLPNLTELSIEELMQIKVSFVSGASRYQQGVENVPASVSVVTSADIMDYGYRTLAEALSGVRGLYLNYDRNYTLLGLRGFQLPGDSNSRILLLVDGQRINENIYDSAFIGTDFILDIGMVDRIEIIRGPGSSIYGSNALFGVINVVTRTPEELHGIESSLETASFSTYKGRFGFAGQTRGGTEYLVSGSLLRSQGPGRLFFPEFADPATNGGLAEGLDDDRSAHIQARVSHGHLALNAALNSREKGIPTASYGTVFNDPRARTTDTQGYVNLNYQRGLSGSTEIMTRASYSYYGYAGTYPYEGEEPSERILNKDDVRGDWLELEGQLTRRFTGGHTLIAGIEHRRNLRQDLMNFDEEPRDILSDIHDSSRSWGAYGQGEFDLGRALRFTAGLRYDRYDAFGGTLNPRLGLVGHPDEATDVKLLYGRAFRAPNVFEVAFFDPASKANPSLGPETIQSYELVFERRIDKNLSITALGFLNRVEDLVTQVIDPVDSLIVNRNTDQVEARGLEFELNGRLPGGLRGRASYTLQQAENRGMDQELPNSPRHTARLNLRVPLNGERMGAGVELQYSSGVQTLAGHRADAIWLTNLTVAGRGVLGGLDLSGSLYNMFDRAYGHPGGGQHTQDLIPQDGRSFRIKASGRF